MTLFYFWPQIPFHTATTQSISICLTFFYPFPAVVTYFLATKISFSAAVTSFPVAATSFPAAATLLHLADFSIVEGCASALISLWPAAMTPVLLAYLFAK